MPETFAGDSFFTLSLWERVGLVALSLGMLAGVAAVSCWLGRRFGLMLGAALFVVAYWLFLWVSPQVYYLYYIAIFDGLPWQIVIGAPLGVGAFAGLVAFQSTETLSAISQAVGFWVCLGAVVFCAIRRV